MLISLPKIPHLVHLQRTTPHSAFPPTLQRCMCKQPPGLRRGQQIQGCPAHSPTTRGISRLLTSKERKITGRSRSHSQTRFSVVLIYEVILIYGNTPFPYSRLKKIHQKYVLLKSKILSKKKSFVKLGRFCNNFIQGEKKKNNKKTKPKNPKTKPTKKLF